MLTHTWHSAGHRVDSKVDVDAVLLQDLGHFGDGILGLGDGHAIARRDDDILCVGDHLDCPIDINFLNGTCYQYILKRI